MMHLVERLADGRWHSGQALASELGISRAAVWKQVNGIRALGLEVHSVRGRGYRLPRGFDPLREGVILDGLSEQARARLRDLEVLATVDSTNARLLASAEPGPRACFAEHQSGGRGRRGRRWCSPFGANLYFSLAWSLPDTPPALGAASLAVGLYLAEWLRSLGAAAVLKWPNDLLLDDAKLGGILIEHRGEGGGACRLVAGVGLNVAMRPGQAEEVDQPWAALAGALGTASRGRNTIAAGALDAVIRALTTFERDGFAPLRQRWEALDALRDRRVWVTTDEGRIGGRAVGVAADGALLVDTDRGQRRFYAGDVSLRAG